MSRTHTWEEAVQWLREDPAHEALVRDCYYDDPLVEAARRFSQSDEWVGTRALLPRAAGWALDLGAGRGIASYALAHEGWRVAALEPDGSAVVGADAIRSLARDQALDVTPVRQYGETLPFGHATFRLVYARAALHHARDLQQLTSEVARVLAPGGRFVAVREHVISDAGQLDEFLRTHPLHRLYGGEHAYRLDDYLTALKTAGLAVGRVLGPFDSVVNVAPMTYQVWLNTGRVALARLTGATIARRLLDDRYPLGRRLIAQWAATLSRLNRAPGRLYSFVAERPAR
jgi:SAM-dependent methyltransferase